LNTQNTKQNKSTDQLDLTIFNSIDINSMIEENINSLIKQIHHINPNTCLSNVTIKIRELNELRGTSGGTARPAPRGAI